MESKGLLVILGGIASAAIGMIGTAIFASTKKGQEVESNLGDAVNTLKRGRDELSLGNNSKGYLEE